jgi:acylphosphatase
MALRLTAFVSGKVQAAGYRSIVIDMANAFSLKGRVENRNDGRVKIIAEGEDEKIKWFEQAIDIKNASILVSSIEKSYSPASGEFEEFGMLVTKDETDSTIDTIVSCLKELLAAVNNMNDNLGRKMDQMNENLGGKMDQMLGKQDCLLGEVRDVNLKLDRVTEMDIIELKSDMAEVKAALRAKGII